VKRSVAADRNPFTRVFEPGKNCGIRGLATERIGVNIEAEEQCAVWVAFKLENTAGGISDIVKSAKL
jgi:hypothetical protein